VEDELRCVWGGETAAKVERQIQDSGGWCDALGALR
jgi:hypothetical protein